MVSTSQEYKNALYKINSNNPVKIATLVPRTEPIYNIDLNTREIKSPEYLSVSADHKAETIYFKVPRYFDNMDLATTSCIIQYKNAKGETHLYIVPYYDVETLKYGKTDNEFSEMIIPWMLEGPATAAAGVVEYAFRFFTTRANYVFKEITKENYKPGYYYTYSEETGYVLSTGFDSEQTYYVIDPDDNNREKEIKLTLDTYLPNTYLIKDKEGKNQLDSGFKEGTRYYELKADIVYSLNTIPAKSKILQGMKFEEKYIIADNINESTYYPGFYYIKDKDGHYILCEDLDYHENLTYYEFSIPELLIDGSLLAKVTYFINRFEALDKSFDLYWEILE